MQGKKTSHIWSPPPKAYKDIPFSFLFLGWGAKYRIEFCPQNIAQKNTKKSGSTKCRKKKVLTLSKIFVGAQISRGT